MTIPGGCLGFLPSTICCSKWALLLLVFIEQHGDASNKKPILRQRIFLWYNDTSTRWWFQIFLCSPLLGDGFQFD